jgi:hypothetical protein
MNTKYVALLALLTLAGAAQADSQTTCTTNTFGKTTCNTVDSGQNSFGYNGGVVNAAPRYNPFVVNAPAPGYYAPAPGYYAPAPGDYAALARQAAESQAQQAQNLARQAAQRKTDAALKLQALPPEVLADKRAVWSKIQDSYLRLHTEPMRYKFARDACQAFRRIEGTQSMEFFQALVEPEAPTLFAAMALIH